MDVKPLAKRERRTQAERSAETRALLVCATTRLLARVGYAAVTTSAIAAEAGVTTGALHHHFGTKEALLFAVLDAMNERVLARFAALQHTGPTLPEVTHAVRELWAVYGDPEYWSVWEIIIGTRGDPELRRRVIAHREATMKKVFAFWAGDLPLGKTEQSALRDILSFMLNSIRGLFLEHFLNKDAAFFRRQLAILARATEAEIARLNNKNEGTIHAITQEITPHI